MAGVRNEFIKEVPELPESSVVINYNEDNEVVSYTVVNKNQGNRPVLIFEPKEFEAYKAGSLSTQGLFLLSPQWSFDIGSAALYADEEKSLGYITDAVTSPEYIFTAITSTMGASAYLGKSSVVTMPKGVDGRSAGAMARREYQGVSYHGKLSNAVKSKAPTNGQDALDASVQVKGTSPRRVGIDYETGEFAVFDQTSNGVFHGHVRGWKDLTSQMQNALRKLGMVDRKGKILGGSQ